jgi:hypothetical protein
MAKSISAGIVMNSEIRKVGIGIFHGLTLDFIDKASYSGNVVLEKFNLGKF